MYDCKTCFTRDVDDFFPTNKSSCKKCISSRNKIKRKTVKASDRDVKEYCLRTGTDFDKICQESENKRSKTTIVSSLTPQSLTPPSLTPSQSIAPENQILQKTIIELSNKINYNNEIMMSRTEYNETGVMEIRRRQEEILADQYRTEDKYKNLESNYKKLEEKYKDLEDKIKIMEQLVVKTAQTLNDNYYTKEKVVEKINNAKSIHNFSQNKM